MCSDRDFATDFGQSMYERVVMEECYFDSFQNEYNCQDNIYRKMNEPEKYLTEIIR